MLLITELWAQASRGHYHGTSSSQLIEFYEEYKLEIENILDEYSRLPSSQQSLQLPK